VGTPLGGSSDASKERVGTTQQDEVILTLEAELEQLRSVCASKDQRIAELSRTDTPAGRLKRDIRNLASELHNTRRQLKESMAEVQELQAQVSRSSFDGTSNDAVDSPSSKAMGDALPASSGSNALRGSGVDRNNGAGADRANLRERITELMEENRQLRETVLHMKGSEGLHHTRQPSGASTQRSSETPFGSAALGGKEAGALSNPASRQPYLGGQSPTGSSAHVSAAPYAQQEEAPRQVLYSSANTDNFATIGPTVLKGVGAVDGVASIAKVLLQRMHSSVCAVRQPGVPGQQLGPPAGQLPLVGVGIHQNM